jgi:sigma-E factor negative regulatory protein RseB
MRWLLVLLAWTGGMIAPAYAETNTEPFEWLGRIVSAAQRLNYTGTFVYQSGAHAETSRITHLVDGSGEREKLEVLDGSPREIVRDNDEVRCFLPAERTVIIDRQAARRAFPARLPPSFSGLSEYYRIRKGELGRVAGFETQTLVLEPRDQYRYGHVLWAHTETGLLLKARMVNERNEPIEQFHFTQLQIGGAIDRESLRSRFNDNAGDWQVRSARTMTSGIEDTQWDFRSQIPGFRKTEGMKRQLQEGGSPMSHYVFSDGLAAISVFIEPVTPKTANRGGTYSTGAINVYKRRVGDHAVILVGEVPIATLKTLGDGIEPKRK